MGKSLADDAPGFVHLRIRSAYSLLEGALRFPKLVGLVRDNAMPAVALTDTNNLFGALEVSEVMAGVGSQPIIGCTRASSTRNFFTKSFQAL